MSSHNTNVKGERDDEGIPIPRRTLLQGVAGFGTLAAFSDDAIRTVRAASIFETEGVAEVVIRAEEVDIPFIGEPDPIARLQAEAAESQEPVVEYIEETDGIELLNQFWLANALLVEVDTDVVSAEELLEQEGVDRLHENFELSIPEPERVQSAGSGTNSEPTYGLDQINAPEVWDEFETRGAGVKVSVIDTGVDIDHPDIDLFTEDSTDPTYPGGWVEIDSAGNPVEGTQPRDTGFHGTHVSGTVAGGADSGTAIGVAPDASLLNALALPGGSGGFPQIIGAMEWSVENGAEVLNLSLGAIGFFDEMIEPVQNAVDVGAVVVSSSGNSGEGVTSVPGNVVEAFSVGASDEGREIADFSSGDEITTEAAWSDPPGDWPETYIVPDVSAPGVGVLSSIPEGTAEDDPDAIYGLLDGTSMAAPHVAGAIALALSAAGESLDVEVIEDALIDSAQKPDGTPDGQDSRYGFGIIDAEFATSQLATESGIEGTVFDTENEPIEGATVTVNQRNTETDDDGSFRLRSAPGSYDVSADAFGFAETTQSVTVTQDQFAEVEFSLEAELGVSLIEDQPRSIESGDDIEVIVEVANLESLRVEQTGDYGGEPSLSIAGEEATLGETFEFEESLTGELTITVGTQGEGEGDVELEHLFDGPGEPVEVTTGPTSVVAETIAVGVVDTPDGLYTDDIADSIERLAPFQNTSVVTVDGALSGIEEYDVFVVQGFADDDDVGAFVDATSTDDIGVIYLDQWGEDSNGISRISEETGNPANVVDEDGGSLNSTVFYEVTSDHELLSGIAEPGDLIELYESPTVLLLSGFHSRFEGFDPGEFGAEVIADSALSTFSGASPRGPALAVDQFERTVYAAALGHSQIAAVGEQFTDDGIEVLTRSITYANDSAPFTPVEGQADRIDPGTSTDVRFEGGVFDEITASLADSTTIPEGSVTIVVNGSEASLGEPMDLGESEAVDIEISVGDEIGRVALDYTVRTIEDTQERETTLSTGPTVVYEQPLQVPEAIDTISGAVDLAAENEEIIVGDGTYHELTPEREDDNVGVSIQTPGLTIRAAEGADPVILLAEQGGFTETDYVVEVLEDGVTIEGFTINVVDDEEDINARAVSLRERFGRPPRDVTLIDLDLAGFRGVEFDPGTESVTIEGGEIVDSRAAIGMGNVRTLPAGEVDAETEDEPDEEGSQVDPDEFMAELDSKGIVIEQPILEPDPIQVVEDITVSDVTIDPKGREIANGIIVRDIRDLQVESCTFVDVERRAVNAQTEETEGVVVRDCEVIDGGGILFFNRADGVVEGCSFEGVVTAIEAAAEGDGTDDTDFRVSECTITETGTGIAVADGAQLTTNDNVVDAEVGVIFTSDGDVSGSEAWFNDLSETETPFVGEDLSASADCRLNYLGERSYNDTIADGDIAYSPFLTSPPDEVDQPEPTQIAIDLFLDPDETYGLGVPGPSMLTIWDVLGVTDGGGHNRFDGEVQTWDTDSSRWQDVTGRGARSDINTLDGFRITPNEGVRAVIDFQERTDVPPGRQDPAPGETEVVEGTNVVCAPAYGDDDVFGGTAEITEVSSDDLSSPRGQIGPDSNREAFTAYIVDVEEAGTIETALDSYDPTLEVLYQTLGLEVNGNEVEGERSGDDSEDSGRISLSSLFTWG